MIISKCLINASQYTQAIIINYCDIPCLFIAYFKTIFLMSDYYVMIENYALSHVVHFALYPSIVCICS